MGNNFDEEIVEIKKRLKAIRKEQLSLDKQIEKQEDDGNYPSALYDRLYSLEDERNNLELRLQSIEK